jgi:hypothetical protein
MRNWQPKLGRFHFHYTHHIGNLRGWSSGRQRVWVVNEISACSFSWCNRQMNNKTINVIAAPRQSILHQLIDGGWAGCACRFTTCTRNCQTAALGAIIKSAANGTCPVHFVSRWDTVNWPTYVRCYVCIILIWIYVWIVCKIDTACAYMCFDIYCSGHCA